jgi:hypothetical protein
LLGAAVLSIVIALFLFVGELEHRESEVALDSQATAGMNVPASTTKFLKERWQAAWYRTRARNSVIRRG